MDCELAVAVAQNNRVCCVICYRGEVLPLPPVLWGAVWGSNSVAPLRRQGGAVAVQDAGEQRREV